MVVVVGGSTSAVMVAEEADNPSTTPKNDAMGTLSKRLPLCKRRLLHVYNRRISLSLYVLHAVHFRFM